MCCENVDLEECLIGKVKTCTRERNLRYTASNYVILFCTTRTCTLSVVVFCFVCFVIHLLLVKLTTRCCIATFSKSACAVAVVDSKVTEVRGNFVEDECYQMATEFQETSLRPDISVMCV